MKDQFVVPRIIGPDRKIYSHSSMREWITETNEFKESMFMNIIDNKVKNLKLQFKKDLEEANADTIDLLRGQKTEIDNLKIKIV